MTDARRRALRGVAPDATTNASLWFSSYLRYQTVAGDSPLSGDETPESRKAADGAKQAHVIEIENTIRTPDGYKASYDTRRNLLVGGGVRALRAVSRGRTVIGLGARGALEAGLTLDRTWGLPYLPGSSLKGIAAAAAKSLAGPDWVEKSESYNALFGTTDDAGLVCFLDAWFIPGTAARGGRNHSDGVPIHLDVMTVHHPGYYQHAGAQPTPPPADFDSPTPIAFASCSGNYLVLLEGPEAWVDAAETLLRLGLEHLGIGAKTSSGYGRFGLEPIKAKT